MFSEQKKKELFFPYSQIRPVQDELILEVENALKKKKNLIVHAPTGLGKTVSTISPALAYALEKDLTIFFLTNRHTQHQIAIETIKEMQKKHQIDFLSADIIGKKWLCSQPQVQNLYSNEFKEYCKSLRENHKCEFYTNTKKKKLTKKAEKTVEDLKLLGPLQTEKLKEICEEEKLCAYEMGIELAKQAKIIITDYYYVFHPAIQQTFFTKINKELEKCILIIDEGHNLPNRIRELLTQRLSNFMLKKAVNEAEKFGYQQAREWLNQILDVLNSFDFTGEKLMTKEDFTREIKRIADYDEIIGLFELIGSEVRSEQKRSYIGSIADFLDAWLGEDQGFARILTKKELRIGPLITLSYSCLDPSLITKDIFNRIHASITMSGTLTPTEMFKDILGMERAIEKDYQSPFPQENKLSLIIPETSTKFTLRNSKMYEQIAQTCAEIVGLVPGNCALFFPSYELRDDVYSFFNCQKKIFLEKPNMSKEEKIDLLEQFKSFEKKGAVLLGVAAANFAEGIDLPGDLLKCVVVVGLPLAKPDLKTRQLIRYFDEKFGKGWDYGYIFPAINKTLQAAGRCIRSETDKGAVIFLDKRFAWENYKRCFPLDWDIKITKLYKEKLKEFFWSKTKSFNIPL